MEEISMELGAANKKVYKRLLKMSINDAENLSAFHIIVWVTVNRY